MFQLYNQIRKCKSEERSLETDKCSTTIKFKPLTKNKRINVVYKSDDIDKLKATRKNKAYQAKVNSTEIHN